MSNLYDDLTHTYKEYRCHRNFKNCVGPKCMLWRTFVREERDEGGRVVGQPASFSTCVDVMEAASSLENAKNLYIQAATSEKLSKEERESRGFQQRVVNDTVKFVAQIAKEIAHSNRQMLLVQKGNAGAEHVLMPICETPDSDDDKADADNNVLPVLDVP